MNAAPVMRFFLDEGVPRSVGRFLQEEGYEVIFLEDRIAKGSKDTLVAAVAQANHAILVTFDSDFKSIAQRAGVGQRRFKTLSILRFEKCRESRAVERLRKALSLILHEWECGNGDNDRRMFVVIQKNTIRTHR